TTVTTRTRSGWLIAPSVWTTRQLLLRTDRQGVPRATGMRRNSAADAYAVCGQSPHPRSNLMSIDVAVLGLGYVGMPLAHAATQAGLRVLGFDVNPAVVGELMDGASHIDDLSNDDIGDMLSAGFQATADESQIAAAKAVVICVPTPL